MATTVTELLSAPSKKAVPRPWVLNVASDNASTAREILAAEVGKKHWIEQVTVSAVTADVDTDWWLLLHGTTKLIGHALTAKGVPWTHHYSKPVPCAANAAINIKTATDFGIHYVVEGYTDPYPELAYSPTPADEATGIGVDDDLQWLSAPWVASHDVYLGTSADALTLQGSTAGQSYDVGTMSALTTYYWRVDADGITGDVWSFTTA